MRKCHSVSVCEYRGGGAPIRSTRRVVVSMADWPWLISPVGFVRHASKKRRPSRKVPSGFPTRGTQFQRVSSGVWIWQQHGRTAFNPMRPWIALCGGRTDASACILAAHFLAREPLARHGHEPPNTHKGRRSAARRELAWPSPVSRLAAKQALGPLRILAALAEMAGADIQESYGPSSHDRPLTKTRQYGQILIGLHTTFEPDPLTRSVLVSSLRLFVLKNFGARRHTFEPASRSD